MGCKALLIPSRCPPGISPSHVGFEPLWALAQEAGLPIVSFMSAARKNSKPDYFNNGLPRVKDFHGGEENFTSLSFMPIPHSVQITLAALIIDGVLDRHPRFEVRRHRTRRILGAQLDALHGFRRLRLHQERAAPAKAIA